MYQKQLSFGEAVNKAVAQNYCNFSGRASRSEYWWYALFTMILGVVIGFVLGIFGAGSTAVSVIQGLVSLALLLPGLGLCVRRLHDISKSGWWIFISLVPLLGAILLIIWFCKPSDAGMNQYGPEPNMVD
ncbi:MAG: DUF805 domain-containing protein [Muribaculaceae bacterium]|nr:DUF805 domain-containing protein [Muribaculaceae bacterium]